MSVQNTWKLLILVCYLTRGLGADLSIGPWTPKFKGVDVSVTTNYPGERFPVLQVVTAVRVDLTDPDIRLFTTPQRTNYIENSQEVGGLTVSDFLTTNQLQVAINANFFSPGQYYLPAGYPMDSHGLQVSRGTIVSPQSGPFPAATLTFTEQNMPRLIGTNWPAETTEGIFTAITGDFVLVAGGENVVSTNRIQDRQPRTAYGLSQDYRYLYLVAIDGRQEGYSIGSSDTETAEWLLLLGAYEGINVDGGGSTTLVMEGSTGQPIRLNRSSAVADSGRERTVGSHFGVNAKALEGFFRDIKVQVEERGATISWTTLEPVSSKVLYGLTETLGAEVESSGLETNHAAHLPNLDPNTTYFYQFFAGEHLSSLFAFRTANNLTTNVLFSLTNSWKFSHAPFTSIDWASSAFNDSDWAGPGPGLLWVNTRELDESIEPRNTELPADPATDYPYITYYFRTHFTLTNLVSGTSLALSALVDDGLVLYLNGSEVWRLRVPSGATFDTLASSFGCDGNATCLETFVVPAAALSALKLGDNVLAAEVHNYNARSGDITFGLAASVLEPVAPQTNPTLSIDSVGNAVTLRWEGAGYRLQIAESPLGNWTDTSLTSPATITPGESRRFFRLARQE